LPIWVRCLPTRSHRAAIAALAWKTRHWAPPRRTLRWLRKRCGSCASMGRSRPRPPRCGWPWRKPAEPDRASARLNRRERHFVPLRERTVMPVLPRLTALAAVTAFLTPSPASALDEFVRASSLQPTELGLCGQDDVLTSSGECKKTDFDAFNRRTEKSLQAALAKAPATMRPLLKRDQTWFNEMMLNAVESKFEDDEAKEAFISRLRQRAVTLDGVAHGFGRPGVAGRWANALGNVTVTPAGGGYRLAIDLSAAYGSDSDRRRECKATAEVKSGQGAWLTGTILPDEAKPAKANDSKSEPAKPVTIKMRRQGESLRVVVGEIEWNDGERPSCQYMWQITGSFFAE